MRVYPRAPYGISLLAQSSVLTSAVRLIFTTSWHVGAITGGFHQVLAGGYLIYVPQQLCAFWRSIFALERK